MTAFTQLASGLGGAIGCDYRRSSNQLFFVEFNGKVSVLDLVRPLAATVSQGTTVLKGTWIFDCETGAQGGSLSGPGDIWWEQQTSTQRRMTPVAGAKIVNLGTVDFNAITYAELQNLAYGTTPIPGNNDATNQLVNGDVFAVLTNAGNFTKVKVINYGYNMTIQWVTYKLGSSYRVLGTGYNQPEDIVVTAGGRYAYVTERSGNLLRVDLTNANRVAATVVSSGMTAPQQIALDEEHSQAYVIEFASAGRLWRVDLTSGAKTVVVSNLGTAVGLLMTSDFQFAYVSLQSGGGNKICRINMATGQRELLPPTFTAPFFMTWTDAGESAILITERDPVNQVTMIDLTKIPITATPVATGVPFRPSSVAVTAPNRILVCSDQEIDQIDLTSGIFTSAGPMLLGIGHVPKTKISADGYATTDPGYFFQVKDTPFGGTLALMFNHEKARNLGAQYYQILVEGVPQQQPWSDYKWNTSHNAFELTANPQSGSFFRVRQAGELWYNYWLGYFLDTTALANGLHTIGVKVFTSPDLGTEIVSGRDSMVVLIDNQWPQVSIDQIIHDNNPVKPCEIVKTGTRKFSFLITAKDPEQHLLSWSLIAMWGDNKSKPVDSDSYSNHISATKKWAGITAVPVPLAPPSLWDAFDAGDPTYSTHCAHTFYLGVWDRVINGYGYIHYSDYHKSITIDVP
jgi:hypothetical protein